MKFDTFYEIKIDLTLLIYIDFHYDKIRNEDFFLLTTALPSISASNLRAFERITNLDANNSDANKANLNCPCPSSPTKFSTGTLQSSMITARTFGTFFDH
ncbi:hypothetical protein DERP_006957 [Dermatophagoides pteronyssinus]|uniref:Uncharacterized protein n=1 Tax=Dermatophagoides pteronyssinus TaxID=6956 RepID=A0ABQ8JTW6_DERPT|nr:hypothetical protein DERP_006957 [Dermatophagoides pteronyssinus]